MIGRGRLERILDEVVQDLTKPIGICLERRQIVLERRLDDDLVVTRPVQLDHIRDQLVHVDVTQLHLRRTRIVGESVDHGFHGLHLLHDRAGQTVEVVAVVSRHLSEILVAQAFRGQLNGCQRILDLVGQTSRHLTPGSITLCLDQIGHVIEDDHLASGDAAESGQRRATAHEDLASTRPEKNNLLAPIVLGRARWIGVRHVGLQGVREGVQVRMPFADFPNRLSRLVVQLDAKNLICRLVAGEQTPAFVQGQHARGKLRQHGFQITALVLHLLLAPAGLVPGPREPPRHVIEGLY